jgi:5-methylcytosine-specific restriction endonuclease McrA
LAPLVKRGDLSIGTKAPSAAGSWRTGLTAAERGYDYRWQKARAAWLKEHPLCVFCEANGRVEAATTVDHKIPHRGDKHLFWDRSNWQSLCTNCHSGLKQRQEAAA